MIDESMLKRLLIQLGYGSVDYRDDAVYLLDLSQAIWMLAQQEEREECAKICDFRHLSADNIAYQIRQRNK